MKYQLNLNQTILITSTSVYQITVRQRRMNGKLSPNFRKFCQDRA